MQGNGGYAARRQYPERNQFYSSNASIFPTHLDPEKRFNSEYKQTFNELYPERPEERTECKQTYSNILHSYYSRWHDCESILAEIEKWERK